MLWKRKKNKSKNSMISPEEILLDASNLPEYAPNTLDGRINRPISVKSYRLVIFLIFVTFLIIFFRTGQLMIVRGDYYKELSKRNRLGHSLIFAERGIIYDRNGKELAWNIPHIENSKYEEYDERKYATTTGISHVLGYVQMPARDSSGVFYRKGIEGVSGTELAYDKILQGTNGTKIVETDAKMDIVSESVLKKPINGKAIHLTIDTQIQEKLHEIIAELADDVPFYGGAGVLMDVETGEILAMTSYPEYSPNAMITGDSELIKKYNTDNRTPFLNRTIAGQYTPGSIVKPFMAAAALNEKIITPNTTVLSTGALRLANPYHPGQFSVFKDWKAHGIVDLKKALAMSSNVYFYYIGGGFGSQEGLGITRINKYMNLFGFGMPTGIALPGERFGTIPSPEWKKKEFPNDPDWRIGDTYHTSIGQYGFQLTPLQAVRAVSAIANGGILLTPRIETQYTQYTIRKIDIPDKYLKSVREGMREAVLNGTAKGLNTSYINIAAKTGTAEIGAKKDYVHSWVIGFFPYEKPKYAFAVLMEHGTKKNLFGGVYVMRKFFDWLHVNDSEYLKTANNAGL
jgi:penicillin-binding protein 2